jgi:hypothetical protein
LKPLVATPNIASRSNPAEGPGIQNSAKQNYRIPMDEEQLGFQSIANCLGGRWDFQAAVPDAGPALYFSQFYTQSAKIADRFRNAPHDPTRDFALLSA